MGAQRRAHGGARLTRAAAARGSRAARPPPAACGAAAAAAAAAAAPHQLSSAAPSRARRALSRLRAQGGGGLLTSAVSPARTSFALAGDRPCATPSERCRPLQGARRRRVAPSAPKGVGAAEAEEAAAAIPAAWWLAMEARAAPRVGRGRRTWVAATAARAATAGFARGPQHRQCRPRRRRPSPRPRRRPRPCRRQPPSSHPTMAQGRPAAQTTSGASSAARAASRRSRTSGGAARGWTLRSVEGGEALHGDAAQRAEAPRRARGRGPSSTAADGGGDGATGRRRARRRSAKASRGTHSPRRAIDAPSPAERA